MGWKSYSVRGLKDTPWISVFSTHTIKSRSWFWAAWDIGQINVLSLDFMFRYGAGRKRSPSGSKSEMVQKRCETSGFMLPCTCVEGHWLCPQCQVTFFLSPLSEVNAAFEDFEFKSWCKLNVRLHTRLLLGPAAEDPSGTFGSAGGCHISRFTLGKRHVENSNSKLSKSKKRSSAW